jgi:uncharacterized membrane protein YgaE (UPF0421/DUF939 family)
MWTEAAARAKAALTRVIAAAFAATLAYSLARLLFGQPQPIFAAITSIICLAPGIPSHFRQSLNILVGVTIGIVVGELIFLIPAHPGEMRIAVAVLVAMLAGATIGKMPVVPIQAGASALLVIVMGPQYAGLSRFLDVIVGVAVGMTFAMLFFRARLTLKE